ncbi:hypothetical protein DICVIV_04888 [Dictyocaulus viviparus]|uniref:Hamartin protein n=1 Tax=Dictyocaulus viviparus TaxID=29172 RepID=A0A0D8XYZ7_DICVI|nr:hypothetical protein DICVIV_04888 [Dictyocaulus viviparus]
MTDILKQINLLESQDSRVSDDARQALSLQINLGNGIYQLVYYYGKTHSDRALDLLCKIREPHDKTFLDSLLDTIREKRIMATLDLLGQIVQTAPSWTPKIALHPVFKAILQYGVNTKELEECIGVLLFATALLPHCCSFPLDVLNALFHTFIESCQIYRNKWLMLDDQKSGENWDRADVAHIAFAIREMFHAIYGIYPTNFISYLRNHFVDKAGGAKRRDVATYVLCPLLAGVRLHPNLILVGKDKELSKERWHQREPHDFLDDCRRNVIGKIPVQIVNDGFDVCSDPGSPPEPHDTLPQLFSSNTSISNGWPNEDSQNDLLNALNTPIGSSRNASPQRRSAGDEDWGTIVITNEEKRRRSVDGGGIRSIRNSIGSFFKRDRGSDMNSIVSSPHRVVEYVADISEDQNMDEAEEAEEALVFLTQSGEQCSGDNIRQGWSTADMAGIVTLDAFMTRSPLEKIPPIADRNDHMNDGLRIAQAAQAAVLASRRDRCAANPDTDDSVVRSRSASFLFDSPHVDDRDRSNAQEREKHNDSDCAPNNENTEGVRNRFSIGSFFSKLNSVVDFLPVLHGFMLIVHTFLQAKICHVRVTSCPNVTGENRAPIGLVRAEITTKASQTNLLERFPYLRLIQNPGKEHYAEIEANLESGHELRRATYMEKSRDFHQCLKELGLADRLPGRIYDDMSHITEGLPMEKQVTEAELEQLKENLHAMSCERKELISALSGLRRSLDMEKRNRAAAEGEMLDKMKELEAECYCLSSKLYEATSQRESAYSEAKQWKSQIDQCRRRADDAEEQTRILRLQLGTLETKIQELKKAQSVNQQLRDHIRMVYTLVCFAGLVILKTFLKLESRCEEERCMRLRNRNVKRERLKHDLEQLEAQLIEERIAAEEFKTRASEWEHVCKTESMRSTELKGLLDRATNEIASQQWVSLQLLREQKDAAEQKFLSLQAVVRRQEEHIFDLYRRLEELEDNLKRSQNGISNSSEQLPTTHVPSEIRSFDSSLSDIYVPRDVLCGTSPAEHRSSIIVIVKVVEKILIALLNFMKSIGVLRRFAHVNRITVIGLQFMVIPHNVNMETFFGFREVATSTSALDQRLAVSSSHASLTKSELAEKLTSRKIYYRKVAYGNFLLVDCVFCGVELSCYISGLDNTTTCVMCHVSVPFDIYMVPSLLFLL